jgi:hypothetical protein
MALSKRNLCGSEKLDWILIFKPLPLYLPQQVVCNYMYIYICIYIYIYMCVCMYLHTCMCIYIYDIYIYDIYICVYYTNIVVLQICEGKPINRIGVQLIERKSLGAG